MIELLKRKIKILESEVGWRTRHIRQLDRIRIGKPLPVEEHMKEDNLGMLYQRNQERLYVINLEIKNAELQAEIDSLRDKK